MRRRRSTARLAWQELVWVTLPMMLPTILVTFAFRLVLAFKVFDEVYLLTGGGPGTATEVVSFTLYQRFFTEDRVGLRLGDVGRGDLPRFAPARRCPFGAQAHGGRHMSESTPRRHAHGRLPCSPDRGCRRGRLSPVAWVVAAGFRTQISLLIGRVLVHARA